MNEAKLQIDDRILDDLVSGNLRGEHYRRVLLALEARPHLWRKCALAFLQEQAFTQDLQALTACDIDWSSRMQPRADREALPALPQKAEGASDLRVSQAWLQRVGALAALLVVSFTIGWMGASLRGNSQLTGGGNNAANQASALGGGLVNPGLGAAGLRNTDLGNALAGAGHHAQPNRSVLSHGARATFDPDSLFWTSKQFMPVDLGVPPQLRELERAGRIRIEAYEGLMPVQLEDGSSALFPIQQFRVVPVMYSY